ncbi:MAG: dihydrolipoamide acetyltransferase family protein [Candidatus Aminicenantales bacterium]
MAQTFRFPDIGEGLTEGEVTRWLVKEGDEIKIDQPLAEIETDKAVVEMPSPYAGTILRLAAKEKEIIKVGAVLAIIGAPGEALEPAPGAGRPAVPLPPSISSVPETTALRSVSGGPSATPKMKKLARDLGVDLERVKGTGPLGRIMEEDVQAFAARPPEPPPRPALKIKAKFDFYGPLERIPLRGIRRATAKKMRESISTAAHVTHCDEADARALVGIREAWAAEGQAAGVKLTYLPFIVKAVVEALRRHPMLNTSLDDEDEEIIVKKYYNIGIAVDVPDGLIVPVVKAADQKTILEIAGDIRDLADAARKRTLDLADLKGGTFSITNVGAIGGDAATPIINYPEVAILATMRIGERARADKGSVRVKTVLPLCLSFDHRVVDGAEAARFTKDLIGFLENPAP